MRPPAAAATAKAVALLRALDLLRTLQRTFGFFNEKSLVHAADPSVSFSLSNRRFQKVGLTFIWVANPVILHSGFATDRPRHFLNSEI